MKELICIVCPRGCHLTIDENKNVTGNSCPRGVQYAINEVTNPMRMLTSTVFIKSETLSDSLTLEENVNHYDINGEDCTLNLTSAK